MESSEREAEAQRLAEEKPVNRAIAQCTALRLKVWRVNYDGRHTRVVAAKSRRQAAELMGVKYGHMTTYGGETWNDEQIVMAMKEPGVVWSQGTRIGSPWVKIEPKN